MIKPSQALIRYANRLLVFIVMNIAVVNMVNAETNDKTAEAVRKYSRYMRMLISMAKNHPNRAPFTAMIINEQSGKILCTGINNSTTNPVLHGEIAAINHCAEQQPTINWSQSTLITTAEPCPMCAGAIIWAGIPRIVYGTSIKTLIKKGWHQISIGATEVAARAPFSKTIIIGGVLRNETDPLFKTIKRVSDTGRWTG